MKANKDNVLLFKKFTRVFVVQNIMCYLDLDEVISLTAVCQYFNSLVKSTFYLKYIVTCKEQTKISINLDAFDPERHRGTPQEMIARKLGMREKESRGGMHDADLEA